MIHIILIIILLFCLFQKPVEGYSNELFNRIKKSNDNYHWSQLRVGQRHNDCYNLNSADCLKYDNCGICHKDGKQMCVPGDEQGAFFKEGCHQWEHVDYYDRYIWDEAVHRKHRPHDFFYHEYETRYPSPQSRASLIY